MSLPAGIKHVTDLAVDGKRVFVRVDFNVPLGRDGEVSEDARIRAALPTVRYARDHGARALVLAPHFGRPKGGRDPKFSLAPIARRLGLAVLGWRWRRESFPNTLATLRIRPPLPLTVQARCL